MTATIQIPSWLPSCADYTKAEFRWESANLGKAKRSIPLGGNRTLVSSPPIRCLFETITIGLVRDFERFGVETDKLQQPARLLARTPPYTFAQAARGCGAKSDG